MWHSPYDCCVGMSEGWHWRKIFQSFRWAWLNITAILLGCLVVKKSQCSRVVYIQTCVIFLSSNRLDLSCDVHLEVSSEDYYNCYWVLSVSGTTDVHNDIHPWVHQGSWQRLYVQTSIENTLFLTFLTDVIYLSPCCYFNCFWHCIA